MTNFFDDGDEEQGVAGSPRSRDFTLEILKLLTASLAFAASIIGLVSKYAWLSNTACLTLYQSDLRHDTIADQYVDALSYRIGAAVCNHCWHKIQLTTLNSILQHTSQQPSRIAGNRRLPNLPAHRFLTFKAIAVRLPSFRCAVRR